MEKRLTPGDPILIEDIVTYLKAKGIFDEFRHECLADVDTKSSCQNLSQRVDGYTTKFLLGETWNSNLNKNELRNKLRRHIDESGMLAGGADHVVEQVINPKINQLFLPRIIEVVHQYLNEETEKINKNKGRKNDNVSSEKPSAENLDGGNKTKAAKLDPIADILSFSYSKPKPNPLQNVQTKVADSIKTERKKDENLQQSKILDVLPKGEKKKEEIINAVLIPETTSKTKKEETVSDVMQNTKKDKDEFISIKTESVESATELHSASLALQTKSQNDSKEPIKIKKEIKTEESESSNDANKKLHKEEVKPEKKKGEIDKKDDSDKKKEDFKPSSDLSSHSEEGSLNKVVPSAPKSSNAVKNKPDQEKNKKLKPHTSSKTLSEAQKSKSKDSDKSSSKSEKHKASSKLSNLSKKDHHLPHKNSGASKSLRTDDKNKSKDNQTKPSDNSVSKQSSNKKETGFIKSKPSSDKAKTPKSSDLKTNIKSQTDSSEKSSKSSLQYSSYDSSQGSDQDKSSSSSSHPKEKLKHFSKYHKKESKKKSSEKVEKTPEKKRFQSDSDSSTPVKHKHMKQFSEKEKKKSLNVQESAKISSRSNSFGSTSSVSDSPSSSSKETSAGTSEEASENSMKSSESKKKQDAKDKERCKQTDDFSPPPPPPPTSGISAPGSSSAEISSMEDTQSSQDSESDSKISDDESSSESDVENLYSSNTLKNSILLSPKLKTSEILLDVCDVFLYSSSSSDFEGYSSNFEEEQTNIEEVADVYVSSVHTSDLSSFDDLLSESDFSNLDIDDDRPARRLTIKEAEKLLEERARQRHIERSKNILISKGSMDDEKPSISPQMLISALLTEDEASPAPEPKRESRRERKLNPKYASNEYASIFNSKKTSFITKQVSPNEDKLENISPTVSETDIHHQKVISPPKRRISMGNLEANQLSDDNVKKSSCASAALQNFELSDKAKRKLSFDSTEESTWNSEAKTYLNSHERNHNAILENTDSHIALKIKKSVIKNDNAINKEPRPQGLKRKLARNEKDDAKKLCRRNSDNSSSSESVPNENNPFNVKANNPSSVFNMEIKDKDFFRKQNLNINRVVLKMEHIKKKSHPKPNHVIETQSSD